MIVPDKFTPLAESIVGRLPATESAIEEGMLLGELWRRTRNKFNGDLSDFMLTLDALFILGRISVNGRTGEVSRAP